jgi:hypothetical protein
MTATINVLTVSGFRSYGAAPQQLLCSAALTIVGGTNSQGKTSLAEAFEFLLTGKIVRREMTASAQEEFADALRNAHLDAGQEVYVVAEVTDGTGAKRTVRRDLTGDYGRREDCKSTLTIDGKPADRADLAALGFVFSQPPLEVPVLAQHTLSYLFSARPQERATYFKTLLEVTDLDDFRNAISASAASVAEAPDAILQKWDKCCESDGFAKAFTKLKTPTTAELKAAFSAMAAELLKAAGEDVPAEAKARIEALQKLLDDQLNKAFPIAGFGRKNFVRPRGAGDEVWKALTTFVEERAKVEAETRRLLALFQAALGIPEVAALAEPAECPLCSAPSALTPARVEFVKRQVKATESYSTAERRTKDALADLSKIASEAVAATRAAVPAFSWWPYAERRALGFQIERIRALLGEDGIDLLRAWLKVYRPLRRCARRIAILTFVLGDEAKAAAADLATFKKGDKLQEIAAALALHLNALVPLLGAYGEPAQALGTAISAVVAANSATVGWQEFLDLANDPKGLRDKLIERHALASVRSELGTALRQIDKAKDEVLEDRFGDLSDAVQAWWELLRPEEMTFFSGVRPRAGAKRTVDLKAALATDEARSNPKLRDAVSILSQSQLHCLGLALFLARAEHEGAAFIVLDDPILSSDEDHRLHFCADVVATLLKKSIQVVILTQDEPTRRNLTSRYEYLSPSHYHLVLDDPKIGTIFENRLDNLAAMLAQAETLSHSNHPDTRKLTGEKLRDAAERYCKEMLVADARAAGKSASIVDHDRKTLEMLIPKVLPLLSKDPAHPGKLKQIPSTLNPAKHDDNIPSRSALRQVLGELKGLKKEYLG